MYSTYNVISGKARNLSKMIHINLNLYKYEKTDF